MAFSILKGLQLPEIVKILNVGQMSVYRWISCYNESGVERLFEGKHTGRPPLLDKDRLSRLEEILDSGPVAYGFQQGIWTCPTVQHVIEAEFNIIYHHDHVRKILHKLGFSVQDPRKKLALADENLQQKWIRETYPVF
ncbi:MAG: winged helix-turn-helix domain-containing protein [Candidatus Edwardsbacteria bacterium]